MRDLAPHTAEYTERMGAVRVEPLWRVTVLDYDIAPTPSLDFDLTEYVIGIAIDRPLRGDMGQATIELADPEGIFDPESGTYADVVRPNGGRVRIELGERLPSGDAYWTVWTGGILESDATGTGNDRRVRLVVGPRGRDLASITLTSTQYGGEGVIPATWEVNDIVVDLFQSFAGFEADEFDLDAASYEVAGIQFESENLWEAAEQCLQPVGNRLWFDDDGTLCSGPLLPPDWDPDYTIAAIAVAEYGPFASGPPEANRILVAGGPSADEMPIIGEPEMWAKGRYAWDHPGDNNVLGGEDCVRYWLPTFYSARYLMAGPSGQYYRRSYITNIQQSICTGGTCPAPFATEPYVEYEWYNDDEDRMECYVYWDTGVHDDLWLDFTFEVWGYPYRWERPAIDAQAWDDPSIELWGERPKQVSAPLVVDWETAKEVAETELVFSLAAARPATVRLRGLDLRVEPGDVVVVERPIGDFNLWVQRVSFAVSVGVAETVIEGYVV